MGAQRAAYLEVGWDGQFFVQHGLEVGDEHADGAAHKLLLQLTQRQALAAVTALLGPAAQHHTQCTAGILIAVQAQSLHCRHTHYSTGTVTALQAYSL